MKEVVLFKEEKETKNTIRFAEELPEGKLAAVIGTLYVPKTSLEKIGWRQGGVLEVTLNAIVSLE